jgi:Na+(H+)/acetate symporter ActP
MPPSTAGRMPATTDLGAHFLRMAHGRRARIAQGGFYISIHLMLFPMAQSLRRFGVYQADNHQVLPA